MIGILFSLLSALAFGISNAWWRFAAKEDDYSRIAFFRGLIVSVVFGISWIIAGSIPSVSTLLVGETVKPGDLLLTLLICLLCSFGLVFFLQSLRYSPVGISSVLSSINVFSILTAVLIIGETFHAGYLFAFVFAIAGVLLCRRDNSLQKGWNKGALFALLASFCWGTGYALFKYPIQWMGPLPLSFILECTVTVIALCWNLLYAPAVYRIGKRISRKQASHYGLLALLLTAGTLFFNLAMRNTEVLLLNLTGNLSLITAVLLGTLWHREKINGQQWIGILLILISLVVVQLIR